MTSGGVTTTYTYDADGARVKKSVSSGGSTFYIGNHYEVNTPPTATTKYHYFGAQRVAMKQGTAVTYLHGDHLGSTSVTSGATSSAQVYYPFGGVRASSGGLQTDFTFTGQKFDASDGLMYYGARYYDAALGRFISADTLVPGAGNPQNLNRYAYVRNNPVKYVDPTGHRACGDPEDLDCDTPSGVGTPGTGESLLDMECRSSAAKCGGFDPSEGYHQFTLTELYANHGIYVNANGELVSRGGLTGLSQNFFNKIAGYWNGEYGTTESGEPYVPGPFEQVGLGTATGKFWQQVQAAVTEAGPMAFAVGVGFAKEWNDTAAAASIPVGRKGAPLDVSPGTNEPTTINGREYSGHALDRMQGRGLVPTVIENTIAEGNPYAGKYPNTTIYYDTVNNVSVVLNAEGGVITVGYGVFRGQ